MPNFVCVKTVMRCYAGNVKRRSTCHTHDASVEFLFVISVIRVMNHDAMIVLTLKKDSVQMIMLGKRPLSNGGNRHSLAATLNCKMVYENQ